MTWSLPDVDESKTSNNWQEAFQSQQHTSNKKEIQLTGDKYIHQSNINIVENRNGTPWCTRVRNTDRFFFSFFYFKLNLPTLSMKTNISPNYYYNKMLLQWGFMLETGEYFTNSWHFIGQMINQLIKKVIACSENNCYNAN